jgi:hypothetical protein
MRHRERGRVIINHIRILIRTMMDHVITFGIEVEMMEMNIKTIRPGEYINLPDGWDPEKTNISSFKGRIIIFNPDHRPHLWKGDGWAELIFVEVKPGLVEIKNDHLISISPVMFE